uniref:nuclear RNA export factor 2-like n=1 Tax=Agelaius phoeniceus TaxID=39638 RepID=UPI0023EAE40A|nr:nuclear RNA export factor 2-like [Agelaius phoeniceus]
MLAAFAMQSGMNLEWSQKCLQDNDWDYGQAGPGLHPAQAGREDSGSRFSQVNVGAPRPPPRAPVPCSSPFDAPEFCK